jgi:hypothetical protein
MFAYVSLSSCPRRHHLLGEFLFQRNSHSFPFLFVFFLALSLPSSPFSISLAPQPVTSPRRSRLIRTAAPVAARRFSAAPAASGSPATSGFDLEMNKVCSEATMASLAKQYGVKSKGQVSTWVGAKMSKTDKLYAYFTDGSGKFTYERVRFFEFQRA